MEPPRVILPLTGVFVVVLGVMVGILVLHHRRQAISRVKPLHSQA